MAGRYTLLDQSAAYELFPFCRRHGVTVLAGGVLNSGILTAPGDGATYDFAAAPAALLARARRMRDVCARHASTPIPIPGASGRSCKCSHMIAKGSDPR